MSRSIRKTPVIGITTARSEKQDKRRANRAERRINHVLLAETADDTALKLHREVADVYGFSKDGKQRIDPEVHPKELS